MQTLLSNFSCKSQKNSGLDKAKLLDHVYHDDELDPIPERVGRATPKPPPARCHPSYQDLMGRVHCDLKLFRASFDDDEEDTDEQQKKYVSIANGMMDSL
ncbi:MAG: hypothetical protein GWP59_07160, partial [Chlamydiales bacterium]|nr:hypothetical protein [Chlamydiales bacterium]